MKESLLITDVKISTFLKDAFITTSTVIKISVFAILMLIGSKAYATDWWNMSDANFAKKYASKAFSSRIEDQSQIAWMLFARVNKQKKLKGKLFSSWELWPSNDDTFSPAVPKFKSLNKIRTRPHLQVPKLFRGIKSNKSLGHLSLPPSKGGEEVTRNLLSYGYIMRNGLNSRAGVWKRLSKSTKVDFPIGTVEIKADWSATAINGAYQITDPTTRITYSLLGLHIMAKMKPTPADPFRSESPSWFWTTFEFKGNKGLANAQSLITYKDVLSRSKILALLSKSGLGKTNFVNYSSNGTQIRFSDKKYSNIILGNTTMEDFAGLPNPGEPGKWTKWESSCHTCHAITSGNPRTSQFYPFPSSPYPTGKVTYKNIDSYIPLDFVWSIYFHAR